MWEGGCRAWVAVWQGQGLWGGACGCPGSGRGGRWVAAREKSRSFWEDNTWRGDFEEWEGDMCPLP